MYVLVNAWEKVMERHLLNYWEKFLPEKGMWLLGE